MTNPESKEERLERLRQAELFHNATVRVGNSPYAKDHTELCCAVDKGTGCESRIYHGTACPGVECPTALYEQELKQQEADEIAESWTRALEEAKEKSMTNITLPKPPTEPEEDWWAALAAPEPANSESDDALVFNSIAEYKAWEAGATAQQVQAY